MSIPYRYDTTEELLAKLREAEECQFLIGMIRQQNGEAVMGAGIACQFLIGMIRQLKA